MRIKTVFLLVFAALLVTPGYLVSMRPTLRSQKSALAGFLLSRAPYGSHLYSMYKSSFHHLRNYKKYSVLAGIVGTGFAGFSLFKNRNSLSENTIKFFKKALMPWKWVGLRHHLPYAVNLFWINEILDEEQSYIYPAKDVEQLREKLLGPLFRWSAITEGTSVNLWYDSKVTADKAVENTQELIDEYSKEHPESAPIFLKDIRRLPLCGWPSHLFSGKEPDYFKKNLSKIFTMHNEGPGQMHHFVCADLSAQPLSAQELFRDKSQFAGITAASLLAEKEPFFSIEVSGDRELRKKIFTPWNWVRINHLSYTVNLEWINKKLDQDQRYIYPAKSEKQLQEKFLDPLFRWSAITQGGSVNLWYDSAVTSAKAVENTQQLIDRHNKKNPEYAPIVLRDVRTLPIVKKNSEVFSDKMPIYFRVDLLRAIIAHHEASYGKRPYSVYADLDMYPISAPILFDERTTQKLRKYGIVMAHSGTMKYENGFQIISNHKSNLLTAMKQALIKPALMFASRALQEKRKIDPERVYYQYDSMFKYFYHLEGRGTLWVCKDEECHCYDTKRDGLEPFINSENVTMSFGEVGASWNPGKIIKIEVPTKLVPLPPPQGLYD
jgi:hypothetical protein